MDYLWVFIAFSCGLAAKQIQLPPLIGYLLAGFSLHAAGIKPHENLETLADMGITLMLFTIGLKINFKTLVAPPVWAGTSLHMGLWTVLAAGLLKLAAWTGMSLVEGMDLQQMLLLGFALSFSSTVCVVKLLEDKNELRARHGKLAVGILVMQDIFAVLFLVLATGKTPSLYAPLLFLLWPARKLLWQLLARAGHGELLPLVGFFFAFSGYELFTLVNLKGDLGALVFGMLLGQYGKSNELAKALLGFKDLFLIGFFLSIGFTALPHAGMVVPILLVSLILILKGVLLFHLLAALRVSSREMFLGSMILTNYSEFGLIVVSLCVDRGWLQQDWLVVLALAITVSFVFTSAFYQYAHQVYAWWKPRVKIYERPQPESGVEQHLQAADALIIGMGRVGNSAYDVLKKSLGDKVLGLELDSDRVEGQKQAGRQVIWADAEDAELWETPTLHKIKLVLIATPSVDDIRNITDQIKRQNYQGHIVAIARYGDDRRALMEYGVDNVFNYYAEAGSGFAAESLKLLEDQVQNQK